VVGRHEGDGRLSFFGELHERQRGQKDESNRQYHLARPQILEKFLSILQYL